MLLQHDHSYGPLMPHHLKAAIVQFPNGTATGADNIAIRAYSALDDKVLLQLCMIYAVCERAGRWPSRWNTVLIVLLLKKDGGYRPVGLFVSEIRIWAKARFSRPTRPPGRGSGGLGRLRGCVCQG